MDRRTTRRTSYVLAIWSKVLCVAASLVEAVHLARPMTAAHLSSLQRFAQAGSDQGKNRVHVKAFRAFVLEPGRWWW